MEDVKTCRHKERPKQFPMLLDFDISDVYSVDEMISHFVRQGLFLRQGYDIKVHGGIRVAVSFGNFYAVGFTSSRITVREFNRELSNIRSD